MSHESLLAGHDLYDDGTGGKCEQSRKNFCNLHNWLQQPSDQRNAQRDTLPISAHRTQILYAVEKFSVVVLVGETGCGKSTQLPQYLYENGWADGSTACDEGKMEYREIICTQPRRIAATTLAHRVSCELGESSLPIGTGIVGYAVRFDVRYIPGVTKIRYVTDGWLLRETAVSDPLLRHCSVLIVDEAHERSLSTDLLLGVIKKIKRKRKDLRVIVCSATINAELFLNFFVPRKKRAIFDAKKKAVPEWGVGTNTFPPKRKRSRWARINDDNNSVSSTQREKTPTDEEDVASGGTIISVDGRQHPVDVMYIKEPVSNYVKSAVDTCLRIHSEEKDNDGDILCFLPTGEDIDEAVEMAEQLFPSLTDSAPKIKELHNRPSEAVFLPLYSTLPQKVQLQVFLPQSQEERQRRTRRIIFASNIAETSVTVPNIAYVIDCGFSKMPFFDPHSGFNRLIVCPISRASACQRAGRAGRVRPGKCYRLYSEKEYMETMKDYTAPEVMRTNLTSLIMTIKALGVKNVLGFDLISIPSVEAFSHALETLHALGAIDDSACLTELGREIIYFPTDPRISRMLLASLDMESSVDTPPILSKLIVGDVLTIAAALQMPSLFYQPLTERQMIKFDDAVADIMDRSGDHVTLVNLFDLVDYSGYILSNEECRSRFINKRVFQRSLDIRNQLGRFLSRRFGEGKTSHKEHWLRGKRQEIVASNAYDQIERSEAIRKCVCAGFFMNVAKLGNDGRYYTVRGKYVVSVSPLSILHRYGGSNDYIMFGEAYDGNRGGIDVRPCSAISGLWLRQIVPHYWK